MKVKHFLILFCLFCVSSLLEAQALSISNQRIVAGKNLLYLPAGAGAYLTFELSNKEERDQYVIVTVRSDEAEGEDACFSAEFYAPAGSIQQCYFPFQLDASRDYTVSADQNCLIADPHVRFIPASEKTPLYMTITDAVFPVGSSSVNNIPSLPGVPHGIVFESLSSVDVPMHTHQLELFRALLIYKTDFNRWHARSYEAVMEYVKNGGTLCFGTPQDAFQALNTPLAELVPLKFSGTEFKTVPSANALVNLKQRTDVPLLYLPAEPVAGAKKMKSPGFVWKTYGKGVVRASVFDIWQSADQLASTGYGGEMMAFLAGTRIPVRELVYTHTRLEHDKSFFFGFPEGKRLIAMVIVLFCGLLLLCVAEQVLRLIFKDKVKKLYAYAAAVVWCVLVLLLGYINGGALFDWVPVPGAVSSEIAGQSQD